MILQKDDDEFLNKLSAFSRQDKTVVYDVMRSFIFACGLEIRKKIEDDSEGEVKITIPFLCNLFINFEDELTNKGVVSKVVMRAEPQDAIIDEINSIVGEFETITEKQLLKQMETKYRKILDISE
ncbi:MAG TPA: hypothetical protein PLU55_00620 [Candidatus Pacearchaeota archaeon]|nr:hypothetical protein [Candidatus Pacearchaeota archaeon]